MNSLPNFPTDRSLKFVVILILVILAYIMLQIKKLGGIYADGIADANNELNYYYWIFLAVLVLISAILGILFFDQLNKWQKQDKKLDKAQDLDLKLKQTELDLRMLELIKLKQEIESKLNEK